MRQFGLIGRTLSHSLSAKYFTDKFLREGLQDECSYKLFELPEIEAVRELLSQTPELVGFNVTIPYKQQIIPYLSGMSDEATHIGAVNCVRVERGGTLMGYNTDVVGIRITLDKLLVDANIEQALILGTGGAAQAVQYVLAQREIPYHTVSRDASKADFSYSALTEQIIRSHRLIINSSPVGMFPHTDEAPAIPYQAVTPSHYMFDLVYNPPLTQFLKYGNQQGAHTISGLDMLYAQAEAAWSIWNA